MSVIKAYISAITKAYVGAVIPGSWLNLPADNITDAMLEEGSEFYMVEEDTADNYLQLVEA